MEFIRFAGTINTHEEKKVAKATVNVILENCTGTFYITDIMFQEGKWLTGYVVNNLELLQKKRVDGEITPQCHLDKDYTKNSVYRNMYPVLFL